MIIWSDEILEKLKGENPKKKVLVKIGNQIYPIIGLEDSQSIGWWEIRFGDPDEIETIDIEYLLHELPPGFMVMLQERVHLGNSYPINQILQTLNGEWILKCNDPESEYWEELRKWKETQAD